jgi:excalibur calcium-binding domain-containing protein
MRQVGRFYLFGVAAAAVVASPLILSSPAMALPFGNCDQAEAAGAAPIFAGQPGYSPDLDADGDGVACELSSGRRAVPFMPQASSYTTYISWAGADCILVRYPNGDAMPQQSVCSPERHTQVHHTAIRGQAIGADPEMGHASAIACLVANDATGADIFEDAADAGDGTDVNCIVPAP